VLGIFKIASHKIFTLDWLQTTILLIATLE
jgi:hypothetical protein